MNNYELTVVLPGGVTPAKKKSVIEKFEKLLKTLEGKIAKTDDWGEIELAYPIKKEKSGNFLHLNLELDGVAAKNIKDKLRVENDILRYLLLRKEKS